MTQHRRVFLDHHRQIFFEAIRTLRNACITVERSAPIGGLDYRTAGTLIDRLDDAVEVLVGDRQALWLKPHDGSCRPAVPITVLPVEPKR